MAGWQMNQYSDGTDFSCTDCPAGNYSYTGSGECRQPIPCDSSFENVCHQLSFCDDATCICPVGLIGDGTGENGCR